MARKHKRGFRGFGETPARHKEVFQAHADLSIAKTLAEARQLADLGRCNDALLYLLSARSEVTAMQVHANGFSTTKGQRDVLERYRDQLQTALGKFRANCLCKK